MATALVTILNWFKTNAIPTEAQFKATFESFRHKLEKVPVADVDGIDNLIAQKADDDKLNSHISDDNRHITAEFVETLQTKVEVFGNWFQLIKHPLNSIPENQNTLENGDFIANGFYDDTTMWVKAQCLDVANKDQPQSWNLLDSIDEITHPSTTVLPDSNGLDGEETIVT